MEGKEMLSYCTFMEQLGNSSVPIMEQEQRSRESDEATDWTIRSSNPGTGEGFFSLGLILPPL
jgi:hypothetical protein